MNATLLFNSLPMLEDGMLRLERNSSIHVGVNMKHIHTFGCPVFASNNALASGNQIPKWSPRACLGLNLGPYPMHARNVYLILSLSTGLLSPQYHSALITFSRQSAMVELKFLRPLYGSSWQDWVMPTRFSLKSLPQHCIAPIMACCSQCRNASR